MQIAGTVINTDAAQRTASRRAAIRILLAEGIGGAYSIACRVLTAIVLAHRFVNLKVAHTIAVTFVVTGACAACTGSFSIVTIAINTVTYNFRSARVTTLRARCIV
jgi:hypothetical protein